MIVHSILERENIMKKVKKLMLVICCVAIMVGITACGDMGTTPNDNNNDVTEGTEKKNTDDGVVDDIGNAVGDGINDIGNGVKDMTDDVTGNSNNNTNR